MNREQAIETIRREKLVAILRDVAPEQAKPLLEALWQGGVRALEFTFDHDKPDCVERTARNIRAAKALLGGDALLGAGTVLTAAEAEAAVEAGAGMVISPHTDAAVIGAAKRLGAVSIPGALTPTEIMAAHRLGADFVKLFPAGELGVSYVKAVRAPLRHIPMLAVGAVTPQNIPDFLKAGVLGFGVGGNLADAKAIRDGDWATIRSLAASFAQAVKTV